MSAAVLGLVEVLDRDGQVRHSVAVQAWPFSIGRALDNDLVLTDPHVAPHHARLLPSATGPGLELEVGSTRNGLALGNRRLQAGERQPLPAPGDADGVELHIGRLRLRLRLPEHALAPEQPLAVLATATGRLLGSVLAAVVVLAGVVFNAYLASDPDTFGRAVGSTLLTAFSVAAVWCTAWALLSKTFTRQAHFGWHLRVFLFAAIGLLVVDSVPNLLAFMFSWPVLADFSFVATIAVAATGLYFHLLAVEPARHRLLKGVAFSGALAGIALTLLFNLQRTDRFGDELYMNHLFPPALRLARPVPSDTFVGGLTRLQPVLDAQARKTESGDDPIEKDNDDE